MEGQRIATTLNLSAAAYSEAAEGLKAHFGRQVNDMAESFPTTWTVRG